VNIQKSLGIIFFVLILLPKINLNSVAGESAGVRIDDIIIAIITPAAIYFASKLSKKYIPVRYLYGYFLFGLLTTVCNVYFYGQGSLLYPIRYFEYSIFIYAGILAAAANINLLKLLLILVFTNYIVMFLQFLGLVGGFSSDGYVTEVSDRVIGLTGGPWEIGVLIVFVMLYVAEKKFNFFKKYIFLMLSSAFLLLTGSRMAILSMLVALLISHFNGRNKYRNLFFAVLFMMAILILAMMTDNPLRERSVDLFSNDNIEALDALMSSQGSISKFEGFDDYEYDKEGDTSFLMRISKWSIATTFFFSQLKNMFLGVGHGLWGPALDGGLLRILTEGGGLGFLLFFIGHLKLSENKCVKLCFIVILINMLMIDIHLSYKIMALFYYMVGYLHFENSRKISVNEKNGCGALSTK
jgi:O-Antigen ligase